MRPRLARIASSSLSEQPQNTETLSGKVALRASMPRGSNFVEEEEIQLCMSYLKISEDPRTGTDQSSATFWKRIHEHFTAARLAFSAAMDKVERRSGASFGDEIQGAQQIYMRMEDRDGVTATKPFKLLHCWRILRSEPLWTSVRNSQGTATGGDAINSESTARGARPQGRKASKEEAKAVASTSSSIAELAKANAEIAAASKKRARAIQDACDVALFTVCLDELDPDSRRFFELRRRQVLGRLERSHASSRETVVAEVSVLDRSGDGCDDQDDTALGVYTATA
ncbi:No apical meristem-associated C-terminal domain [Phytophthora infestans]|uniref:No apical meristem-associated C-terminal domain n=1 Tax=Phytophthora infestans TaxID=4787 RepID=A0A8S9V812_PHYIN|nr:No apical meristem-associated C-terminal domain [Phytophthora infestans]